MSALERPQLRAHLNLVAEDRAGCVLGDPLRLAVRQLRLTRLEMQWLKLFDGRRTLADIQSLALRSQNGQAAPLESLHRLVRKLDDALFLEGPRFRARLREQVNDPIRPPACIDSYGDDPIRLRRSLDRYFHEAGGPGRPGPRRPDPRFRAALVPHIDYGRGGRAYAWAFKEVWEHSPAMLFVIVGTSHYSHRRFTLTRKHFRTPLGLAPTDQKYIDRLIAHYGDGLFDDELPAHLPEHSIELEVVFLQYLYPDIPFRIVPLAVGSFHDCIVSGCDPSRANDIGRMMAALRAVESETNEPICYLISGDLAHLGPKFGDPFPVSPTVSLESRRRDMTLLHALGEEANAPHRAEQPDADAYFRLLADEGDARRICGLPPTYTVLQALQPQRGEVLYYDQYMQPDGFESVSFASVVFYK